MRKKLAVLPDVMERRHQCILLANQNGLSVLENFVYGDTPELADIEHVLRQIANAGERWEVMLNRLANEAISVNCH